MRGDGVGRRQCWVMEFRLPCQWENTVGGPSKGGLMRSGEYGPSPASALTWKAGEELQQEPAPEPR